MTTLTRQLLLLSLLIGTLSSSISLALQSSKKKPRLSLVAVPRVGSLPLTVQFHATIQNADERDPELHCLDADWDFDHVRFFDRKDCPPFEDGAEIQKHYFTSHTFNQPGTYRVRLSLRRGKVVVLRTDVWIRTLTATNERATIGLADVLRMPLRAEVSDLLLFPGQYLHKTVIVKGKLESRNMDEYTLRDRRTAESVRVVFRNGILVPVLDEVEVKGIVMKSNRIEPPPHLYIDVQTLDSLEYDDENPSDLDPSGDLAVPKPAKLAVPDGPPPEVIFTLPLDGERNIDLNTEFSIQFSEDMHPASFNENVELQYSDAGEPGPEVAWSYDELTRALVVRSQILKPGREVRLILYEGITSKDGVPVVPILSSRRASLSRGTGRRKVLILTYYTRFP